VKRSLTVACPTCRAEVEWSDATPWRPFCSARCRGIDLGDWASNRFVVAGAPLTDGTGEAAADYGERDQ
jgi:endogenous inhibitor of DNA gyrase (YacG/DUF329 family)